MIGIQLSSLIKFKNKNSKYSSRDLFGLREEDVQEKLSSETGHATNAYIQDTAKYYGIELSGTIPICVSCSIKKIRQKNIPKNPSKS